MGAVWFCTFGKHLPRKNHEISYSVTYALHPYIYFGRKPTPLSRQPPSTSSSANVLRIILFTVYFVSYLLSLVYIPYFFARTIGQVFPEVSNQPPRANSWFLCTLAALVFRKLLFSVSIQLPFFFCFLSIHRYSFLCCLSCFPHWSRRTLARGRPKCNHHPPTSPTLSASPFSLGL